MAQMMSAKKNASNKGLSRKELAHHYAWLSDSIDKKTPPDERLVGDIIDSLHKGIGANVMDARHGAPIHVACALGHVPFIIACLEHPNQIHRIHNEQTPVHILFNANAAVIRDALPVLIAAGAQVNDGDAKLGSLLCRILEKPDDQAKRDVFHYLLARGADPNHGLQRIIKDKQVSVKSPLISAMMGSPRAEPYIAALVQAGADINMKHAGVMSPLTIACIGVEKISGENVSALSTYGAQYSEPPMLSSKSMLARLLESKTSESDEKIARLLLVGARIIGLDRHSKWPKTRISRAWKLVAPHLDHTKRAERLVSLMTEEPALTPWAMNELAILAPKS